MAKENKKIKAHSAPGVTQAAREAKAMGLARFSWICSIHGEQLYYSSSKACPACTVDRKDKEHQSEYNLRVKEKYPHVRRPDGTWTRKKV